MVLDVGTARAGPALCQGRWSTTSGGSVKGEGEGKDADLTVDIITGRGGEAAAKYDNVADDEGAARRSARPSRPTSASDTW